MMYRFFLENLDTTKENVVITGDEFYHLKKVLRLNAGDEIIIFDGKGNDFIARIETLGAKEAVASLKEKLEISGESKIKIVLAQGLAKGSKMDMIIQKATELGVSEIIAFITSRTVPKLKENTNKKIERWKSITIESSKQCGRSIIPKIEEIKSFNEILKHEWKRHLKIILWENAEDMRFRDKLSMLDNPDTKGIIVIVGPEGGFSIDEVNDATNSGFLPVRLFSDIILRTETAAIAALSIINYEISSSRNL